MKNNTIIISSHPDDESLGCGDTLLKHHAHYWLIIPNVLAEDGYSKEWRINSRQIEIGAVASHLGVKKVFKLDYPTMKLSSSSLQTLIPKISSIFYETKPSTVYLLNRSDAHSDHRTTFEAAMACTKSLQISFYQKSLSVRVYI